MAGSAPLGLRFARRVITALTGDPGRMARTGRSLPPRSTETVDLRGATPP